jgi:hypothetical protein
VTAHAEIVNMMVVIVAVIVAVVVVAKRSAHSPFGRSAPRLDPAAGSVDPALHRRLAEWAEQGLITGAEADAVEEWERRRATDRPSRVPFVAEELGYVGGGLVFTAVALVVGRRWDDLAVSGRVGVLAIPTLVFALSGWWFGIRPQEPLRRLGSVIWLLAGVGLAGTLTEIWIDVIGGGEVPDRGGVLFVAGITLVPMVAAFIARREPLQQVAVLVAVLAAAAGVVELAVEARDGDLSESAIGVAYFLIGAAWVAGGVWRRLEPPLLAVLSGAGLVLISPEFVRADHDALGVWLGIGGTVALLVLGVVKSDVTIVLPGTIGLFQWTPQLALFYLADTLGAEATLAVIGTLLLVLAALLMRLYPHLRERLDRVRSHA